MASVGDFPHVPVHFKEVSGDPKEGIKALDLLFDNFEAITVFSETIPLKSISQATSSNFLIKRNRFGR